MSYIDGRITKFSSLLHSGLFEITLNIFGTVGDFMGSIFWLFGPKSELIGTWIFLIANIACAVACAIYGAKYSNARNYAGAYAFFLQAFGCSVFSLGSALLVYNPEFFNLACSLAYLIGSLSCLIGCILSQVLAPSWTGLMAGFWPHQEWACIPTGLLNSSGSFLFSLGSLLLFYKSLITAGVWMYIIGSAFYIIASWGDMTIWWAYTLHPPRQLITREDLFGIIKIK